MKQIKTILIISLILVFFLINTSCRDNTSELNPQLGSQKSSLLDSQIIHQSNLSSQQILRADISGKDDLWADKRLKIGFVGQGYAGEWYSTLVKDMLNSAEDWNIDIQFKDAGGKKESQKEIIQNFLLSDIDAIGIIPTSEIRLDDIIRLNNKPIILFSPYVEHINEDSQILSLVEDDYKEGQMAGEWLIEYMEKQGKLDEKIKIAELRGTEDSFDANTIEKGFSEVINNNNHFKIIISQDGRFTKTKGYEVMKEILSETTDIDVLFCHNDDMAIGAIEAIEEAGLVPGKDIIIISIMGTNAALKAIVEGKIACSVECNPLMGDLFMEACVRLANGETIEREIHPVDRMFDITNAQAELDTRAKNGYGY